MYENEEQSETLSQSIALIPQIISHFTFPFSVGNILLKSVFISISHFFPLSYLDKENRNREHLHLQCICKQCIRLLCIYYLVSSSLNFASWFSELVVDVENKHGRILIIWSNIGLYVIHLIKMSEKSNII